MFYLPPRRPSARTPLPRRDPGSHAPPLPPHLLRCLLVALAQGHGRCMCPVIQPHGAALPGLAWAADQPPCLIRALGGACDPPTVCSLPHGGIWAIV